MARKLRGRQQLFVSEYLVDFNAYQAAIRAGYSARSAKTQCYLLLNKPGVQAAIKAAMKERVERNEIKAEHVFRELLKIGFADMKDYVEYGPNGMELKDSAEVDGTVISEISEIEVSVGEKTRRRKKLKLHNKLKALELAGRYLGMFKDKLNLGDDINIDIKLVD